MHSTWILEILETGPLAVNCTLLGNRQTQEAVVIDPGGDASRIGERLSLHQLRLTHILATHGHFDHIGGVYELQQKTKAHFWIHELDLPLVKGARQHARQWGIPFGETPTVDGYVADHDLLDVAGLAIEVIHTPGHTQGGVCFRFGDTMAVGDTLFAGSIGRTDLPGGNMTQLLHSIRTRLFTIAGNLVCLTGHGGQTTLDRERRSNPFLLE